MNLIERGVVLLFKKCIKLILRFAPVIIIYSILLLICITSQKCFRIKNFNYLVYTALFAGGALLYKIYEKFLKRAVSKLLFTVFLVLSYYLIGYYITDQTSYTYMLPALIKINSIIYNSQELDFKLLAPFLYLCLPLLIVFLFSMDRNGRGGPLIILTIIFMANQWLNGFDNKIEVNIIIGLYLVMIYYSLILYRKSSIKLTKQKILFTVDRNKVFIYGLLLSVFIMTISSLLIKTLGSSNLDQIVTKVQDKFFNISDEGRENIYDLGFSGYNEENLGGPVTLNSGIAFRVESDKPYYLRGIIKDAYNGRTWKRSYDILYRKGWGNVFAPYPGYVEYMTALPDSGNSSGGSTSKLKSKRIAIYPERLSTSTFFTPYNTINVKASDGYIGFTFDNTFMLLDKKSVTSYYNIDFYESASGLEKFPGSLVSRFAFDYNAESNNDSDIEYYEKKVKNDFGGYLSVPENLPDRVRELVKDITRDSTSSNEKVMKIYKYLKGNYKYSLDVKPIPEDREFLDYFLFDEKQGYCTYFATAAVLFCRLSGIPARYVEGFNMSDLKDSKGLYVVENNRAHAWCEILISREHNIWSVLDTVPEASDVQTGTQVQIPPGSNIYEQQYRNYLPKYTPEPKVENAGENEVYRMRIEKKENKIDVLKAVRNVIIALPFLLILLLLLHGIYRIKSYYSKRRLMVTGQSVIPLYYYAKNRMKSIGIAFETWETEDEYANKIEDTELKSEFASVIKVYNEEFFGCKVTESFDKSSFYGYIESYIRKRQNLMKYLWYKYYINS